LPIKLFILGDVRLHREGLALQLAGVSSLQVVGTGTLSEALRTLLSTPVDVALLDTVQLEIATVVVELRRVLRRLRIIAMGVREVEADGEVPLTNRELQVVELINRGLSNKEISSRLRIEPCTAKNHVQNIMQKLGAHSRGEAVAKLRGSIGRRFGKERLAV
jgi:DNA-binding NarL/FixJ family response regulator